MPFRNADTYGTFAPEDLQILQETYNLTCEKLGRCPTSHKEKNKLARLVIRVYSSGETEPKIISEKAIDLEKLYSHLTLV